MTTLYIVRHGETFWNTQKRWQGQQDSALTPVGRTQVEKLAQRLAHVTFSAIHSSDLPRAIETASILALNRDIPLHTNINLRERKAGPIEGTTAADRELQPHLKNPLHTYLQLAGQARWKEKPFPAWESNQEVAERFEAALLQIASSHPDQTILVVAHGGNIRNFLAHIEYIPINQVDHVRIQNAGLVILEVDNTSFTVVNADGLSGKKQE